MKVVELNNEPARNPDVVLEKAKGVYESVSFNKSDRTAA